VGVEGSGFDLFEFLTNNLPRKIEVTKIVVSVVVVVVVVITIIIIIIIMALTRSCSIKNFGSKCHVP
jgi:hypothetical protein